MIILGDIASANKDLNKSIHEVLQENRSIFKGEALLYNQEGLITDSFTTQKNTPVLYSNSGLLSTLKENRETVVAALANNHTLDLPEYFNNTIKEFRNIDIRYVGAGLSRKEARNPTSFFEGTRQIIVFNFCWDFLLYHQKNPTKNVYVAEIKENSILQQIKKVKDEKPNSSVIVYFHWSLDLETLPYPMYREYSRALIDTGADVVVGCHSHCVQGGEKYANGYIVYSLGNFFIPWNVYAGGKLNFPELSKVTLALEWNSIEKKAVCHWFEYQENDHSLKLLESGPFENSSRLKEYTPYESLTNERYVSYFRKNRRKKILIPVYIDYRKERWNRYLTFLLKIRARMARTLAKYNLIKWQN